MNTQRQQFEQSVAYQEGVRDIVDALKFDKSLPEKSKLLQVVTRLSKTMSPAQIGVVCAHATQAFVVQNRSEISP